MKWWDTPLSVYIKEYKNIFKQEIETLKNCSASPSVPKSHSSLNILLHAEAIYLNKIICTMF